MFRIITAYLSLFSRDETVCITKNVIHKMKKVAMCAIFKKYVVLWNFSATPRLVFSHCVTWSIDDDIIIDDVISLSMTSSMIDDDIISRSMIYDDDIIIDDDIINDDVNLANVAWLACALMMWRTERAIWNVIYWFISGWMEVIFYSVLKYYLLLF